MQWILGFPWVEEGVPFDHEKGWAGDNGTCADNSHVGQELQ